MLVWELKIGQGITLEDRATGTVLALVNVQSLKQKRTETTVCLGIEAPQSTKIIKPKGRNDSENGKANIS